MHIESYFRQLYEIVFKGKCLNKWFKILFHITNAMRVLQDRIHWNIRIFQTQFKIVLNAPPMPTVLVEINSNSTLATGESVINQIRF